MLQKVCAIHTKAAKLYKNDVAFKKPEVVKSNEMAAMMLMIINFNNGFVH